MSARILWGFGENTSFYDSSSFCPMKTETNNQKKKLVGIGESNSIPSILTKDALSSAASVNAPTPTIDSVSSLAYYLYLLLFPEPNSCLVDLG